MFKLSKKEDPSLGEVLPYYSFDNESGAIWLKDGSATLSLRIEPKECRNLTDEELESLRFGLTPVLGKLPEGSVFQALMLRERSTPGQNEAFERWKISHLDGAIQDESIPRSKLFRSREDQIRDRIAGGGIFQTRCYVTLRSLPDAKISSAKTIGPFSYLSYSSFKKRQSAYRSRSEILHDLTTGLESLKSGLEAIGFEVSDVEHAERLRVIYDWMNPERSKSLGSPAYLAEQSISEQVTLTDLVERNSGISLGRQDVKIVSLKSLPEISIPAALEGLANAQYPYSLVLTVFVLPQTAERERLMRKQRIAQGMAAGNTVRNLMAEAQLSDIESTLSALISSGERLLAVSFQLVGLGEAGR